MERKVFVLTCKRHQNVSFSVSELSHTSLTQKFKYGKLNVRNRLNQVA